MIKLVASSMQKRETHVLHPTLASSAERLVSWWATTEVPQYAFPRRRPWRRALPSGDEPQRLLLARRLWADPWDHGVASSYCFYFLWRDLDQQFPSVLGIRYDRRHRRDQASLPPGHGITGAGRTRARTSS